MTAGYTPPPTPSPLSIVGFCYLSTPTVEFSDRDLSDLLLVARSKNAHDQITGKLIALEDGDRVVRFAQWIEGPPAEMKACVGRIMTDLRHDSFEVTFNGLVPHRRFAGWDMAYVPADALTFPRQAAVLAAG